MANYSDLKAAIDVNIRNNGNGEITGDVLNQVLKNMVNVLGGGYQFAGAATTEMNPGTPDNNVYYVTTTAGTYTNFGGLVVNDGELALLTYNGNWQKVAVTLPAGGGGGSTSDVEIRPLTLGNTETEKQYNIETIALVKQGKAMPVILELGSQASTVLYPQISVSNDTNVMEFLMGSWFAIGANSVVQLYVTMKGTINADGSYTEGEVDDNKIYRFANEKIFINANEAEQVKWLIDNYAELRLLGALPIPYIEPGTYNKIFPVYMSVGGIQDYAAKIIYIADGLMQTFFFNAQGEIEEVEQESAGPGYKNEFDISSPATLELKPNHFYRVSVSGDTVITLADTGHILVTNEYVMKIVCTGTPNITLPDGLVWANDTAPVFTAGKTYVISIIDNLAVFAEFTTAS